MTSGERYADASYDVVIVGAGMTGLALAKLLSLRSVRVAVVDPNRVVCQHPRASHLDAESVRVGQVLGLTEAMMKYEPLGGVEIFDDDGNLLLEKPQLDGETDQGWELDYQFFQPNWEAVMRGQLVMSPVVDLWLGWRARDVSQTPDEVSLTVDRLEQSRELRARYVIGCDGAGSMFRDQVVRTMHDLGGFRRSVIVDIQKFSPLETLSPVKTFMRTGARPVTHVPTWGGISRFQFGLGPDDDPDEMEDPSTVYELLSEYLTPDSYRILRTNAYEYHSLLAEGWRVDRVLIAGDAAHQMPPHLGQGACSGLRDAANLAWKLADVLAGLSPADLLDTYETERSEHVRSLIEETTSMHKTVVGSGEGKKGQPPGRVEHSYPSLGAGLGRQGDRRRGELSPQQRTANQTRMDDIVGYNFVVIGSPETIEAVQPNTRQAWSRLDAIIVTEVMPRVADWLEAVGADAALIRPDRYVVAATAGPHELDEATAALFTQLGRKAMVSA